MQERKIIDTTKTYVQKVLNNDSSHDWWHVFRVWEISAFIAKQEKANSFIVEMAALLHDVEDWKFKKKYLNKNDSTISQWLKKNKIDKDSQIKIQNIIKNISFKGACTPTSALSIEGKIVQDADRLDAIGAIGIARAFAYGGFKKREMYNPSILPKLHASFAEYKKSNGTTINHFYEKLLLLKDKINTKTGKKIAKKRHKIMEHFLQEFFKEWDFNDYK